MLRNSVDLGVGFVVELLALFELVYDKCAISGLIVFWWLGCSLSVEKGEGEDDEEDAEDESELFTSLDGLVLLVLLFLLLLFKLLGWLSTKLKFIKKKRIKTKQN